MLSKQSYNSLDGGRDQIKMTYLLDFIIKWGSEVKMIYFYKVNTSFHT